MDKQNSHLLWLTFAYYCSTSRAFTLWSSRVPSHHCTMRKRLWCDKYQRWRDLGLDNTKRKAGRTGGPCYQMKNLNFLQAACHTEGQDDRLHYRTGQWAAHLNLVAEKDGPEGCSFLQPALPFSAARRTALLCSLPAHRKFTFFIWKHGLPARPAALQLVLSLGFSNPKA